MVSNRKLWKSLSVVATLVLYGFMVPSAVAGHGGGGHGGGGHGGGGFHGGGHEGGHGEHPYRPSGHHADHHDNHGDHHADHRDHHHDGWHHGGWGPGYEGGWGPVYAGWGGDWGDGGEIVNNTYDDESSDNGDADNDDNGGGEVASNENSNGNNQQAAANNSSEPSFPTDNWPELGIVTYAGEYGGSDGQVIMRVVPNSSAAKAGFVPGDVILTFNGAPVPSADELDEALNSANGKFAAEVWDSRTGRRSTLNGSYDAAPAKPPTKTTAFTPAPAK